MCGIAGLFLKNPELRPQLGQLVSKMMIELSDRGPDSAGLAVYRENGTPGRLTVVDHSLDRDGWQLLTDSLRQAFDTVFTTSMRAEHLVIEAGDLTPKLVDWFAVNQPTARIVSVGERIEIYKEAGHPADVLERLSVNTLDGTHAVGHTRMATESAVTTEHSHPFSTGQDLCLVHNGSLSNHNRLRRQLQRSGISFETDNDSEVAAGYLTWRLRSGDTMEQALEAAIEDLDGFYTFAIGSRDGFSVLRDPIACKPAVLAETEDWVAMSSEYRAISGLPGANHAEVWEPEPAKIYSWQLSSIAA